MVEGVSTVKKWHRDLAKRIGRHLEVAIGLDQFPENGDWANAAPGTTLEFGVLPERQELLEYADRRRGGRWPVVAYRATDSPEPCAWLGWRDAWVANADGTFAFRTAGWTVFWGRPGALEKVQLFRAEWDIACGYQAEVAQPHWHLDRDLVLLIQSSARGTDLSGDGEPFTADEGMQELDVSGPHLGMAGWQNRGQYPKCWQAALEAGQLGEWSVKTLELVLRELELVRASRVE